MTRVSITSPLDGFTLPALSAHPQNAPIGGVVVIQEIFGLTDHIADISADFASQGYAVLAPALFERVATGFHAELDTAGIEQGRAAVAASPWPLHYGARDTSIPPANIERVRQAAPDAPLYLYDAGHGFCRDGSQDFDAVARDLAFARTMDWFARWR